VGYLFLAMSTVLGLGLAWRAWKSHSDDNPLAVLVVVWVMAGIVHTFVRNFWRACTIAAGSALAYVVLAVALTPNPFLNEMFGAGILQIGLLGFLLSILMGVPVVIYRRRRHPGTTTRESDPA
jgi:hypothetical protein